MIEQFLQAIPFCESFTKTMDYEIKSATREDISWIARFEAEMYSGDDAVPEQILSDWYDQNPDGFWIIKHKGTPIGHLDILPIKPEVLQSFIAGLIVERDIRGIDLYTPKERGLVRTLYVESIAISPSNGHNRAFAVRHLLSNLFHLVSRIADPSQLSDLYAIAATSAGQRFLGHLGFVVMKRAQERKDQHDLFSAKLLDLGSLIAQKSAPQSLQTSADL